MKKLLIMLLVVEIVFGNKASVFAKNEQVIITQTDEKAEEFVKENLASLLVAQQYDFDLSELNILTGMYVYGYLPYELTIYPVEKAGHVVATIQVMRDQSGNYCATYSMEFVDQLNCLLRNMGDDRKAMAIIEGESIEFVKVDESKLPDSLKERDTENRSIYDLSFNVGDVVKGTKDVIYICNWITHDIYSNQSNRCVPYSMHNILYNKRFDLESQSEFQFAA